MTDHPILPRLGVCLAALGSLWLAGCPGGAPPPAAPSSVLTSAQVSSDDLVLTLQVDQPTATVGQSLNVQLTGRNTGRREITIDSPSSALMIVTLWRYQWNGWQRCKEYPASAVRVRSPWRLAPREERTFHMSLPVEPDWPVLERMRLTAELNGRPDVRPQVMVSVQP